MKKLIALIAVIGIVFSSCNGKYTIAKRKYNKGFYIAKSGTNNSKPTEAQSKTSKVNTTVDDIETEIVGANSSLIVASGEEPNISLSTKKIAEMASKPSGSATQKNNAEQAFTSNQKSYVPQKVNFKSINVSKDRVNEHGKSNNSDAKLILCVILAIFIPPLGMYLWDKKTDFWFIIDLILFLLLFTWFFLGALGLAGLAAIVIALLRVFDAL